ncbi:S26 family signal peptidase [Natronococcus occultus]|uniref:S26 family signal peptidase n=1 Tax=Natronococcus occultus TaxID=29288 RepID=UPI0012F9336F|nr:S26 family signal peptidase [Natronococcus occultus]
MKVYELLGAISLGGLVGVVALLFIDDIIAAGIWHTGLLVIDTTNTVIAVIVEPVVASLPVAHAIGTGSMGYTGGETIIHDTGYGEVSEEDIIVFDSPASDNGTVHRAHFYVEEDENWYQQTDPELVDGAEDCEELRNCPAPHDGWITAGDEMDRYDQAGEYEPVKSEWIDGRAVVVLPL